MGKIKRERQKFHIAAENKVTPKVDQKSSNYKLIKSQLDAVENIFSGITIKLDNINKFEEFVPTPPDQPKVNKEKAVEPKVAKDEEKLPEQKVDSNKATGKHLTKKEKMALKHQKLMEKLDVTQKARKTQKQNVHRNDQTLSTAKSEFRSLLTPAAVKSSKEVSKNDNLVPKNVFSIPILKDDLPALDPIFKQGLNGSNDNAHKITTKSKNIGKKANSKKNFVANYDFLRKAMAKKKK